MNETPKPVYNSLKSGSDPSVVSEKLLDRLESEVDELRWDDDEAAVIRLHDLMSIAFVAGLKRGYGLIEPSEEAVEAHWKNFLENYDE
jgi:hypothetical protein